MSKIIQIFLIFFFEKLEFRRTFLLKMIFRNFKFKTTFLLKYSPIFDKVAKLDKASWDAFNWGGWLIF